MSPNTKAAAVVLGTLTVLTVLAAFWITSPTGLHSDADVRASAQPDRLTWERN